MERLQLRNMIFCGISSLLLTAFVVSTFAKFNYQAFAGVWWNFVWWALAVSFVLLFCITLWALLDDENNMRDRPIPNETERAKITNELKEIHLAHFNHTHQEVTRYRDLPWKIGALTWAIYSVLIWSSNNNLHKATKLQDGTFFIFFIATSAAACVFILFFEVSANRNRTQRREIAEVFELHDRWRPTENGERLTRAGFWFSMLIFLIIIWLPPLFILFYRTI